MRGLISRRNVTKAAFAASTGVAMVGHKEATAQDVLADAKPMSHYTALRVYTGQATGVRVTKPGIAGFFYKDQSDTTSDDNGGTVIIDASGRRWKRMFSGSVKASWFGATSAGDSTQAIQNAINFCAQSGGGVEIDGIYQISSINNKTGVSIFGNSWSNGLKRLANSMGAMIKLDTASQPVKRTLIFGFMIDGNKDFQTDASPAIDISYSGYSNPGNGSTLLRAVRHQVKSMHIINSKGDGVYLGYAVNDTQITDNIIYSCDGIGINSSGSADGFITGNDIGQSGQQGILITGSNMIASCNKVWCSGRITAGRSGINIYKAPHTRLIGNECQENSGPGIEVSTNTGQIKGLIISGQVCDSNNTALGASTAEIKLADVLGAVIQATIQNSAGVAGAAVYGIELAGLTEKCDITIDARDYTGDRPVRDNSTGSGNHLRINGREIQRQIQAFTASYVPKMWDAKTHVITLTGNIEVSAVSNPSRGMEIAFEFIQDAIGGRKITWDSAYIEDFNQDTRPNRVNQIAFRYDGKYWKQIEKLTGMGGTLLLVNGDFSTLAGWKQTTSGGGVVSLSGGQVYLTVTGAGVAEVYQQITTTPGKRYRVVIKTRSGGALSNFAVGTAANLFDLLDVSMSGNKSLAYEFTATTANAFIRMRRSDPGQVSIEEIQVSEK